MNQIINNQTTLQDDTNAMSQAASEVLQDFGKDSAIGQSYLKLAEAAEKASLAFERLLKFGEERERRQQV